MAAPSPKKAKLASNHDVLIDAINRKSAAELEIKKALGENEFKGTILDYVSKEEDFPLEPVKQLIQADENLLKVPNSDGDYPVHEAILQDRLDLIQLFVAVRPKVLHQKDSGRQTPLELAVDMKKPDICEFLLGFRDCYTNPTNLYNVYRDISIWPDNMIGDSILNKIFGLFTVEQREAALIEAVNNESLRNLEALCRFEPEIVDRPLRSICGRPTMIFYCVNTSKIKTLQWILDSVINDIDLSRMNSAGVTVFLQAVKKDVQPHIVKLFLEKKPELQMQKDSSGNTSLAYFVQKRARYSEFIIAIISNGDVDLFEKMQLLSGIDAMTFLIKKFNGIPEEEQMLNFVFNFFMNKITPNRDNFNALFALFEKFIHWNRINLFEQFLAKFWFDSQTNSKFHSLINRVKRLNLVLLGPGCDQNGNIFMLFLHEFVNTNVGGDQRYNFVNSISKLKRLARHLSYRVYQNEEQIETFYLLFQIYQQLYRSVESILGSVQPYPGHSFVEDFLPPQSYNNDEMAKKLYRVCLRIANTRELKETLDLTDAAAFVIEHLRQRIGIDYIRRMIENGIFAVLLNFSRHQDDVFYLPPSFVRTPDFGRIKHFLSPSKLHQSTREIMSLKNMCQSAIRATFAAGHLNIGQGVLQLQKVPDSVKKAILYVNVLPTDE